jgi:hypothetical protein
MSSATLPPALAGMAGWRGGVNGIWGSRRQDVQDVGRLRSDPGWAGPVPRRRSRDASGASWVDGGLRCAGEQTIARRAAPRLRFARSRLAGRPSLHGPRSLRHVNPAAIAPAIVPGRCCSCHSGSSLYGPGTGVARSGRAVGDPVTPSQEPEGPWQSCSPPSSRSGMRQAVGPDSSLLERRITE